MWRLVQLHQSHYPQTTSSMIHSCAEISWHFPAFQLDPWTTHLLLFFLFLLLFIYCPIARGLRAEHSIIMYGSCMFPSRPLSQHLLFVYPGPCSWVTWVQALISLQARILKSKAMTNQMHKAEMRSDFLVPVVVNAYMCEQLDGTTLGDDSCDGLFPDIFLNGPVIWGSREWFEGTCCFAMFEKKQIRT